MNVKGTPTNLEIDTGARCNILSLRTVRAVNAENEITASDIFISGVHGHPVKALGQVMLPCSYKGQTHVVFQVLSTSKKTDILGRYDSSTYGLLQRVHTLQCNPKSAPLLEEYNDVFNDKIGCIPGEYDIEIDEDVSPVVCSTRPVPAPLRAEVKERLEYLEKNRIITKVTQQNGSTQQYM